jgi:hypothetical protein
MKTLQVNAFPDGSRAITLDAESLFNINSSLLRDQGSTLYDLAAEQPVEAYMFLRLTLGNSVLQHCGYTRNGVAISSDKAEEVVLRHLPAPYEGIFDVEVRLFSTPEEDEMGLGGYTTILNLHVEPVSLT